jgi:hypothetical protein
MTIAVQAAGRQWTVASQTQPGVLYIVRRHNGVTTCDCLGGFHHGRCKHQAAIDAQYPARSVSMLSPEAHTWGIAQLTGSRQG